MTKDTALTLALGCLEMVHTPLHQDKFDAAIAAIREALAAPQGEPYNRDSVVVNLMRFANIDKHLAREIADKAFGSVAAPAPLSDEQILEIEHNSTSYAITAQDAVEFARAIERHVKGEK